MTFSGMEKKMTMRMHSGKVRFRVVLTIGTEH